MEHDGTTNLAVTEAVRSVQLLKIDGYCATATMSELEFIKSRWCTNGHEWEVRFHPTYKWNGRWVAVKLILISEPLRDKLRVSLSCCMTCTPLSIIRDAWAAVTTRLMPRRSFGARASIHSFSCFLRE